MNPYILFEDIDDNGIKQKYILQRDFPHYVGQILYMPKLKSLIQIPVPKYNIWVSFAGTLRGNMIPSYKNIPEELDDVYRNMSSWYYENIILKNEKEFENFKLKTTDYV